MFCTNYGFPVTAKIRYFFLKTLFSPFFNTLSEKEYGKGNARI